MGARNSGHGVQGHVDCTGTILSFTKEEESLWVQIEAPAKVLKFIVPKGYIAVDGTSLTVVEVNREEGWFNLMLVAHTQTRIVLPTRAVGDAVNLEADVIAKYSQVAQEASDTIQEEAAAPSEEGEIVAIRKQLGTATKHGAGLQVPLPTPEEAKDLKIAIIHTCWHEELIMMMVHKCADQLALRGVPRANIMRAVCPGSYELPYLAHQILNQEKVDAVVCVGILLKGGTIHMEVIADAVTNKLMDLQVQHNVPVIFGVLTVLAIEQAVERAESALPASWADSALTMALHKRKPRISYDL